MIGDPEKSEESSVQEPPEVETTARDPFPVRVNLTVTGSTLRTETAARIPGENEAAAAAPPANKSLRLTFRLAMSTMIERLRAAWLSRFPFEVTITSQMTPAKSPGNLWGIIREPLARDKGKLLNERETAP